MKNTGLVLLIVGILLTIFTTFKYFTTEKIIEIGDVEITKEQPKRVSWSPWIGVAVIVVGGAILWQSAKKK